MKYLPGDPPGTTAQAVDPAIANDLEQLKLWVSRELRNIAGEISNPRCINFQEVNTVPARYKTGDTYYFAAGVAGAGAGLYFWDGAAWVYTA